MSSRPYVPHKLSAMDCKREASMPVEYPTLSEDVSEHDLPHIDSSVVSHWNGKSKAGIWLVIDNIVYDCSNLVDYHPGGDTVIRSFAGKDCSWQFHKIHTLHKTRRWLPHLRVGRTEGVENPFPQPGRGSR